MMVMFRALVHDGCIPTKGSGEAELSAEQLVIRLLPRENPWQRQKTYCARS
jgi:hypothetical protein